MKESILSFFSEIDWRSLFDFFAILLCIVLVFPLILLMIRNIFLDDWTDSYDTFSG